MISSRLLISRNFPTLSRSLSTTTTRKMPFVKNEIVPDVIPKAPTSVLKVDYASGGDYSINWF
jgi:hypothetical protein